VRSERSLRANARERSGSAHRQPQPIASCSTSRPIIWTFQPSSSSSGPRELERHVAARHHMTGLLDTVTLTRTLELLTNLLQRRGDRLTYAPNVTDTEAMAVALSEAGARPRP